MKAPGGPKTLFAQRTPGTSARNIAARDANTNGDPSCKETARRSQLARKQAGKHPKQRQTRTELPLRQGALFELRRAKEQTKETCSVTKQPHQ
jgi:hypothetical protein